MILYLAGAETMMPELKQSEDEINMKLYFAGAESKMVELGLIKHTNELYNYYRLPNNQIENMCSRPNLVFLDSGGFSAFTIGAEINIDEYCNFIKKHSKHIDYYAQLDCIGDDEGTQKNLEYMESKGLKPLPVFHYGSDYKRLEELLENYEYICLGGLVPLVKTKKILMNHLDKCFSIIRDRVKVHGFGMTGIDILKRYPWYSVDSTAWIEASRRGTYFEWKDGDMIMISSSDKKKANYKSIKYSGKKVKGLWRKRLLHAIREWIKCEQYITKLWQKKGIEWQ